MQKSMRGLLRTLLNQVFEQKPNIIPEVVRERRWQLALYTGSHTIDWSESELHDCLRECILKVAESGNNFFLVDGLDEFEGTDEAREELINLLISLADHVNVKICISSRPWNIFRDAFGRCPQLKIEDLTYNDISTYVREKLHCNRRFRQLVQFDTTTAEALVKRIIHKAAGVFLWVWLVVRQLLKGLCDGDGIHALNKMVEEIPANLDNYFMRLIESIEPGKRYGSSLLLQIALYEKDEFFSLHSKYLINISFIEEGKPDFALDPLYNFSGLDFSNNSAMAFQLESALRKLNSCCVGVLECIDELDQIFLSREFRQKGIDGRSETTIFGRQRNNTLTLLSKPAGLFDGPDVFATGYLSVDFLHRSFRDFLLKPEVQSLLHQYTQGPYEARMFLRNARLVQLVALTRLGGPVNIIVGLASYVLSTLTVSTYRNTPGATAFAILIRPVIESLVQSKYDMEQVSGWYISRVLESWHAEESTFLTLAIDFGLESYVHAFLTPESVQNKTGRPILDYILRPRFVGESLDLCVGSKSPDSTLLKSTLGSGVDPNQTYQDISVWALFLCLLADYIQEEPEHAAFYEAAYFEALKIMIEHGVHVLLPGNWLADSPYFQMYGTVNDFHYNESSDERFWRRFPDISPAVQGTTRYDTFYAVGDLLECFRYRFGSSLDRLKELIQRREAQILS